MSAYRTNSVPPKELPKIMRSATWNLDDIYLRWNENSQHVEVGVHNKSGAALQWARLSVGDADRLYEALGIAIQEARHGR